MNSFIFSILFFGVALLNALGLYFIVPFLSAALVLFAGPGFVFYQILKQLSSTETSPQEEIMNSRDQWSHLDDEMDYVPSHFGRHPKILIVDDDIEVALAMNSLFCNLGCETQVATSPRDVAKMMSFEKPDFIVLDWLLGEHVTANQVIDKAVDMIDSLSSLQSEFRGERPKVITYSSLNRSEIDFPDNEYFEHLEHWEKAADPSELEMRSKELLVSYGF